MLLNSIDFCFYQQTTTQLLRFIYSFPKIAKKFQYLLKMEGQIDHENKGIFHFKHGSYFYHSFDFLPSFQTSIKLFYPIISGLSRFFQYNNFDNIEHFQEQSMFQGSQSNEQFENDQKIAQKLIANNKKERKIKKRRNKRSCIHINGKNKQEDTYINSILDLIMTAGNSYFNLSKKEILTNFKYAFKTSFHIKNIISQQPKVFEIQGPREVISDAQRFLSLINTLNHSHLVKVYLSNQSKKIILNILIPEINKNQSSQTECIVLSENEYSLLEKREKVLIQVGQFLQQNVQPKYINTIDSITKQIISLCRINSSYENKIIQSIYKFTNQGSDLLYQIDNNPNQYSSKLSQKYIIYLIRKNLTISFDQTPIDLMNYFPLIEYKEKNMSLDFSQSLITNYDELQEYFKAKKPKPGKNPQESLKTGCSGCFSNYSQLINPIEVCSQCGMRMHKLCQPMQTKCQRCKYIRKTIEEKNHLPYCYICNRQKQHGLALEFVYQQKKEHFAHTFCLLINKFWTVHNAQICYQKIVLSDSIEQCQFCLKQTAYYHTCNTCGQKMHGLCAYLEGCSLFFDNQNQIKIICCRDERIKHRLSYERKYRLNFQKNIYKKRKEYN